MFLLLSSSLRPRSCAKTIIARYLSQETPRPDRGFEEAGIRPSVAAALRVAFPNAREPTAMQRKLIRAMSQNRNVLLQDDTGTGKSFAAMLALLSKVPGRKKSPVASGTVQAPTSLLLVPHRDLAYQYLYWMHHMTLPEGASMTKHAQVLLRHVNKETLRGLPARMQEAILSASSDQEQLVQNPPRILIATPNAILELMQRRPDIARPSTVVVDEVDALLHVPSSKLPRDRRKKLEKHVPDVVRILDRLYATSRERSVGDEFSKSPACSPQLVMISATLRHRLQSALFGTYGWVKRGEVLKLMRKRPSAVPAHRLGRSAVHHVLVVSKTGEIKNMEGARPSQVESSEEEDLGESMEEGISYEDEDDGELVDEADKELADARLDMDPGMLEAVAVTVALDVPRVALLVLPATAAVRKIVFELRQLGVDAQALNLVENEASRSRVLGERGGDGPDEGPVLIVGTLATIRGIDLGGLSHVFMVGVPVSGDEYVHVGGRVGRFGGRGKVISVVEEERVRDMKTVLGRLGIEATRIEHFE